MSTPSDVDSTHVTHLSIPLLNSFLVNAELAHDVFLRPIVCPVVDYAEHSVWWQLCTTKHRSVSGRRSLQAGPTFPLHTISLGLVHDDVALQFLHGWHILVLLMRLRSAHHSVQALLSADICRMSIVKSVLSKRILPGGRTFWPGTMVNCRATDNEINA